MATKLTDEELIKLNNLLNIAINLKRERKELQIVDEFRTIEEKDVAHTLDKEEIDLGFKYEKQVKSSDYKLGVNEKWGENILGSDVSIKHPYKKDEFVEGNLVVLVPVKKLVRKKTKEALLKFEERVWDEIEILIKKDVDYEKIKLL